jgi:hypothetical protein
MRNGKIFVEMVRYSGNHKYLLGFYEDFGSAQKAANVEYDDRGGKYSFEIYEPHYYKKSNQEVNELIETKRSPYERSI